MVHWMDHVDSTLRTILHEVNTLEEFEKEKTIFQVSIGQFYNFSFIEIFKYFTSPFLHFLWIASDFDGKYTYTSLSSFIPHRIATLKCSITITLGMKFLMNTDLILFDLIFIYKLINNYFNNYNYLKF